MIVPNGKAKLVIPFKNGLVANSTQLQHCTLENKITFIGVADIPSEVDFQYDKPAGNIIIEFSAMGAYRFFNLRWVDVKNRVVDYSLLESKVAFELDERLGNAEAVNNKLQILLRFLMNVF